MPADIKASEINWLDPVQIDFGFTGLSERHAKAIMRDIIRDGWPESRRPRQCIYVIRLTGVVAVDYPGGFSPVVYVGEGDAYSRIYQHTHWLTDLAMSVPQIGIEVQVAEVARRNHPTLYRHIEADMLEWFANDHGALPWFNKQFERTKARAYEYERDAEQSLRKRLGVGSGNKFLWAIKPTKNNEQFEPYERGLDPGRRL